MVKLNVEAGIPGLVFSRNFVSNSNWRNKRQPCLNNIISAATRCVVYYFNVDWRTICCVFVIHGTESNLQRILTRLGLFWQLSFEYAQYNFFFFFFSFLFLRLIKSLCGVFGIISRCQNQILLKLSAWLWKGEFEDLVCY